MLSRIIQENKEWNYLEIWDYLMRCYGCWIPKEEFLNLTASETDWFVDIWNKRNRKQQIKHGGRR